LIRTCVYWMDYRKHRCMSII